MKRSFLFFFMIPCSVFGMQGKFPESSESNVRELSPQDRKILQFFSDQIVRALGADDLLQSFLTMAKENNSEESWQAFSDEWQRATARMITAKSKLQFTEISDEMLLVATPNNSQNFQEGASFDPKAHVVQTLVMSHWMNIRADFDEAHKKTSN